MNKWYCSGEKLLREISDTHGSENELALWYIGQCGFIVKYQDTVLAIDPVLSDLTDSLGNTRRHFPTPFSPEKCKPDFVVCTHGHADHLALPTVQALDAPVVLPMGCRDRVPGKSILPTQPGDTLSLTEKISLTAFSAAHPNPVTDPDDPNMALGYCIRFGDIRLVHLGDTYLTASLLRQLEGMEVPHIFLPPINGDDRFRANRNCIGNMEAEEAAKLAAHIHADLSIPTHYDMVMGNTVDPLRFAAELRRISPASRWRIPALGERILYRL